MQAPSKVPSEKKIEDPRATSVQMDELLIYGPQATESTSISSNEIFICNLYSGERETESFKEIALLQGQTLDASTGSYVFAIPHHKAALNVYTSGQSSPRVIEIPENLSSVKVSPLGIWIAGGSLNSGKVYLWELASGNLTTVIDKHENGVGVVKFTRDESFLFTGSHDGSVFGWRMLDLIASDTSDIQPAYAWDETHASSVSSICMSYGHRVDTTVYTSSADKTVRVWSLASGGLDCTYIMDDKVSSLALDPVSRVLYAGLANGDIVAIDRYKVNPITGLVDSPQAIGEHVSVKGEESNTMVRADGLKSAVSCLEVSMDGSILAAGYSDGQVCTYNTASREIRNQLVSLPAGIASLQIFRRREAPPRPEFVLSSSSENTHDVWLQIKDQHPDGSYFNAERCWAQAETFSIDNTDSSLRSRIQAVELEIARIKTMSREAE